MNIPGINLKLLYCKLFPIILTSGLPAIEKQDSDSNELDNINLMKKILMW